jgi:polar amino acid transport system substrate-binding protein
MVLAIRRRVLLIAALLQLAMLAFAQAASAESTLDKIKRTGVFLAGVRVDFPPVGMLSDSGNSIGFAPDLAKIFADKLGVKVKYVLMTSATRIPLLLDGEIDADIGFTTPTKQRNEIIDFTTPYVWGDMILLVKKGSSQNLADYGPPKRIAGAQGSPNVDYIKEKLPNAQIVAFQNQPDVFAALFAGKVDAAGADSFNAMQVTKQHPGYVVTKTFAFDPMAIGVRQNDSKWRNWLNFTMQEMWQKGQYQALYEKWFDQKPDWQIWSAYRLQPGIGQP